MGYTKTTWVDRAVQNPNNYTASGAVSGTVTLTPSPGTITNAGTPLNAAALNNLESITDWAQMTKLTQDTGYLLDSIQSDLNSITAAGFYSITATQTTNLPTGVTTGFLQVQVNSNGSIYQQLMQTNTVLSVYGQVWYRQKVAGSWSSWLVSYPTNPVWTNLTLTAGTVNNSRPPQYMKCGNVVHIQGEISNLTGVFATLPAGYRPKQYALNFKTAMATGASVTGAIVSVGTDGTINILATGNTSAVSLANISFVAEQ